MSARLLADQMHTGPDLPAYAVCLSAPLNKPYSSTMVISRQTERQTESLTASYLVPALLSVCRVRRQGVYLARWWNVCVTECYADRVQITAG